MAKQSQSPKGTDKKLTSAGMSKVRGIYVEALVEQGLIQAQKLANIKGTLRWNEKPQNLSNNPDFTFGEHVDEPTHIVMVNSSSSSRNSEMKMWRNLDEFQEVKVQLPSFPQVTNLLFQAEVKKGVSKATSELYDAMLVIAEQPYGETLIEWANEKTKLAKKSREEKSLMARESLEQDSAFRDAMQAFAIDLAKALCSRNTQLDSLWRLMQMDYREKRSMPVPRKTFLRRGLGKLCVLPNEVRHRMYANLDRSSFPLDGIPEYAFELGLLGRFTMGDKGIAKWKDTEIRDTIGLIGAQACEDVLSNCPSSMNTWIVPLRNLDRVQLHVDFIENNYAEITSPEGLKKILKKCYSDPAKLSGHASDVKVWVFQILLSLIKAQSGKLQGYGYADLSADCGVLGAQEGMSFNFALGKFTNREKMLPTNFLERLSLGLTRRFQNDVPRNDLQTLNRIVTKWVIKENLEDRLISYRNFEPLLWLLEAKLRNRGMKYEVKRPWQGWINEFSDVGRRSATTPFLKVSNTLIHWKSAPKNPKDKTKELSARARNVRYQFDGKGFAPRTGVKQLAIIIDGTFTQNDLQHLSYAGWDKIYYPDELDALIDSIE